MAKNKTEESKAEKIKINVGASAQKPGVNVPEGGHAKKARDDLWNHPDLDGGFAEEMEHRPGETVQPVDLSGPEQKPEKETEQPPQEQQEEPVKSPSGEQTEPQPEPEIQPEPKTGPAEESTVSAEEERPETTGGKTDQGDAVYKNDEEFYSSKLNLDLHNAKAKSHKTAKKHSRPRKYLNSRFMFILMLFITTLVASFIMLAIIEQLHPGSSMLFDYIPLPEFVF